MPSGGEINHSVADKEARQLESAVVNVVTPAICPAMQDQTFNVVFQTTHGEKKDAADRNTSSCECIVHSLSASCYLLLYMCS